MEYSRGDRIAPCLTPWAIWIWCEGILSQSIAVVADEYQRDNNLQISKWNLPGSVSAAAHYARLYQKLFEHPKEQHWLSFLFPNGSYCFLKNKDSMYRAQSRSRATLEWVISSVTASILERRSFSRTLAKFDRREIPLYVVLWVHIWTFEDRECIAT